MKALASKVVERPGGETMVRIMPFQGVGQLANEHGQVVALPLNHDEGAERLVDVDRRAMPMPGQFQG